MKRSCLALLAIGSTLLGQGVAQAQSSWWNPAKMNAYLYQVCAAARTGVDKDECQYTAEKLIENLRDCIRQRSPYAATCQSLLPGAQAQLAEVNNDPVLLDHRQDQRDAQWEASVRAVCAQQNGGYFMGAYTSCVSNQGVDP
jgi:hypothetical protein